MYRIKIGLIIGLYCFYVFNKMILVFINRIVVINIYDVFYLDKI